MRVVDDAVLALLEANGIDVSDGLVDVDTTTNVVSRPLPYCVYYSNVGSNHTRRLGGRHSRRSVLFQVTYVGQDRNQAKWLGEKVRALLDDRRFVIPDAKSWLCQHLESQRVRRDDDVVRPNGEPLFYGVDIYDISITY